MSRLRVLDLFCGAGGASAGFHRAGFDVLGVDIEPQPNYPFEFVQADAMTFSLEGFDVRHASPPCQSYSGMSDCRPGLAGEYMQLIDAVRARFIAAGGPWVIENVQGSGLPRQDTLDGRHGVELCGAMFGKPIYRHRLFETSFPVIAPVHQLHKTPASKAGHWKPGTFISVAGNCAPIAMARDAMGIDWMTRDELAESIPPYYTQFIGEQLQAHLLECAA